MPVFSDKAGRQWKFDVDFGVVMDWKAELSLDLGDATEAVDRLSEALLRQPFAMADMAWVACRAEAQAAGLTKEKWVRGLSSDTDAMRDAIAEGVVLFFHGRKRGPAILPLVLALLRGEELPPMETPKATTTSNASDTNSPESSESTPAA